MSGWSRDRLLIVWLRYISLPSCQVYCFGRWIAHALPKMFLCEFWSVVVFKVVDENFNKFVCVSLKCLATFPRFGEVDICKDKFRQWILHSSAFLETFQGMITCMQFPFKMLPCKLHWCHWSRLTNLGYKLRYGINVNDEVILLQADQALVYCC